LHSAQDKPAEERKFESTIPAHVPIKVKVKNEQAFKNMGNENWARDLEIEVKNTGNKSIYFLYLVIVLPDVTVGGYPYGFQVTYGRKELVRITTPLQSDDMPIQPGASITLKIPETQLRAYEGARDEEKLARPKRVEFDMQLINFGDGTGLRSKLGLPHPDPAKRRPSSYLRRPDVKLPSVGGDIPIPAESASKSLYFLIPARFLRVNFLCQNTNPSHA
jgi:hypothetical protein